LQGQEKRSFFVSRPGASELPAMASMITDTIRRMLIGIARRCAPDDVSVDLSVFNASRITKLYGTLAKGDSTADRNRRLSKDYEYAVQTSETNRYRQHPSHAEPPRAYMTLFKHPLNVQFLPSGEDRPLPKELQA